MVYSNALCNIAATLSGDCQGGLFRTRPSKWPVQSLVTTSYDNEVSRDFIITNKVTAGIWEIKNMPLLTRAWVLQKRLLAKRVLHFGMNQIFFECLQNAVSEYLPHDLLNRADTKLDQFGNRPKDVFGTEESIEGWKKIVSGYSKCGLTKGEDKLVALSGVAKRAYEKIERPYLAGLWKSFIGDQLCWYTKMNSSNDRLPDRPEVYRAPTWSWASIDTTIYWKRIDKSHIKLIDTSIDLLTKDEMGPVKGGSIRIQGRLEVFQPRFGPYDVKIKWDSPVADDGPLFRVYLGYDECDNTDGELAYGYQGLCLVLQATKLQKGQFKRCGLLVIDMASTARAVGEKIFLSWKPEQKLKPENYEEHNGEDQYTFTIV